MNFPNEIIGTFNRNITLGIMTDAQVTTAISNIATGSPYLFKTLIMTIVSWVNVNKIKHLYIYELTKPSDIDILAMLKKDLSNILLIKWTFLS